MIIFIASSECQGVVKPNKNKNKGHKEFTGYRLRFISRAIEVQRSC